MCLSSETSPFSVLNEEGFQAANDLIHAFVHVMAEMTIDQRVRPGLRLCILLTRASKDVVSRIHVDCRKLMHLWEVPSYRFHESFLSITRSIGHDV